MHHIPNFDIARLPERLILPDSYPDSGCALEIHSRGVALYSRKVRLLSDLLLPELETDGAAPLVQETDYYSSLCTNEAARREDVVSTSRAKGGFRCANSRQEPPRAPG